MVYVGMSSCTDGVISYNVRQGDRRGTDLDFVDFTYDGMIQDKFLLDGLGQLMDGEIGDSNFRLDHQSLGIKGYEWVGWRNDSMDFQGPLQITVKFNTVRNFTSVILNCNNHFSKDIRVFKMALVYFSVGGNLYQNKPVKYDFIQDSAVEYSRPVLIRLHNNVGRYVRLQLYFDAKWMMISEIQFYSGKCLTLYHIMTPFNAFANRADPDQTAFVRAALSQSTLFALGKIIYLIPH